MNNENSFLNVYVDNIEPKIYSDVEHAFLEWSTPLKPFHSVHKRENSE